RPRELARLAEQALSAFLDDPREALGRVRQLLFLAADLAGGPREPHEMRDDRGRRTAFASRSATSHSTMEPRAAPNPGAREHQFEVLELPCQIVHPADLPLVAERLEKTIEETRALLWGPDESDDLEDEEGRPVGPRALAESIGDELLVRSIPVIPEDE